VLEAVESIRKYFQCVGGFVRGSFPLIALWRVPIIGGARMVDVGNRSLVVACLWPNCWLVSLVSK
jgi:hypothetical protein